MGTYGYCVCVSYNYLNPTIDFFLGKYKIALATLPGI